MTEAGVAQWKSGAMMEQNEDDSSSSSVQSSDTKATTNKQDAMAYLLRYETMVRQQEAEDMAVIAHLRPCIQRLLELLGQQVDVLDQKFLQADISFEQLKLAYDILLQQQNEFMTTDRQFMMVLKLLTQKVDLKQTELNATVPYITWAEVIQCYKVCVSGMLTLQHSSSTVRARTRDRTLALLSLFEAPSTQLFHQDAAMGHSSILDESRSFTRATRNNILPREISSYSASFRKRNWILAFLVFLLTAAFGGMVVYTFLSSLPKSTAAGTAPRQFVKPVVKPTAPAPPPLLQQKEDSQPIVDPTHRQYHPPAKEHPAPTGSSYEIVAVPARSTMSFSKHTVRSLVVAAFQQVTVVPKKVMNLLKHLFQWLSGATVAQTRW